MHKEIGKEGKKKKDIFARLFYFNKNLKHFRFNSIIHYFPEERNSFFQFD